MDDPLGAADPSDGALTSEERAALAAWAEHDASDGFADAVLQAWSVEQSDDDQAPLEPEEQAGRRTSGRMSMRSVIGLGAAVAAAAAVMLMVRVAPPGTGQAVAGTPGCEHAESSLRSSDLLPSPTPSESASLEERGSALGDDAVAVLARHCSPCHDGEDVDARARALDVFDVQQRSWWPGMSSAQLTETRQRIERLGSAREDERRSVAAFVDAQLSLRAHAG